MLCSHHPVCPDAGAVDRDAAHIVASFPEQGWSLLCNGVIVFDDTGELLPDGRTIDPRRGPAPHAAAEATDAVPAEVVPAGIVNAAAR